MDLSLQPSPLRLADLPEATRRWLATQRFDSMIEKHEGPWAWDSYVSPKPYEGYDPETGEPRTIHSAPAEFLQIAGRDVLLPVRCDHHEKLRLHRVVVGEGGETLTLFMSDTTYWEGLGSGRVGVCERVPEGVWYLCHFWHAWYPTPWPKIL